MKKRIASRIFLCLALFSTAAASGNTAEAYPKRRVIEIRRADGSYQEAVLTRHSSRMLHRSVKRSKTPEVVFGRYIKADRTITVRFRNPLPEADRNARALRRRDIWNYYSTPVDSATTKSKNKYEKTTSI